MRLLATKMIESKLCQPDPLERDIHNKGIICIPSNHRGFIFFFEFHSMLLLLMFHGVCLYDGIHMRAMIHYSKKG